MDHIRALVPLSKKKKPFEDFLFREIGAHFSILGQSTISFVKEGEYQGRYHSFDRVVGRVIPENNAWAF